MWQRRKRGRKTRKRKPHTGTVHARVACPEEEHVAYVFACFVVAYLARGETPLRRNASSVLEKSPETPVKSAFVI
jgi:hypothetical protein